MKYNVDVYYSDAWLFLTNIHTYITSSWCLIKLNEPLAATLSEKYYTRCRFYLTSKFQSYESLRLAGVGCEKLRIKPSGVHLERTMSSRGLRRADEDEVLEKSVIISKTLN